MKLEVVNDFDQWNTASKRLKTLMLNSVEFSETIK